MRDSGVSFHSQHEQNPNLVESLWKPKSPSLRIICDGANTEDKDGERLYFVNDPLVTLVVESEHDRTNASTHTTHQKGKDLVNSPPEKKAVLPEDTYSLLVFSRFWSTLNIASFIALFQLLTITILLADVIDIHTTIKDDPDDYIPDNPVEFPAAVTFPVAIAQLIALAITIFSVDDLIWAMNVHFNGFDKDQVLNHLCEGFNRSDRGTTVDTTENAKGTTGNDEEMAFLVLDRHKNPSKCSDASTHNNAVKQESNFVPHLTQRWYASNALRLLEGCSSFVGIFILIVRSETVLDVLLNFTAINFVSQLDNLIFLFAKWGYFGPFVQSDACHPICDEANFSFLKTLTRPDHWNDRDFLCGLTLRVLLPIVALVAWAAVIAKQNNGHFLSPEIYAQMGDETDLTLGTYSGIYVRSSRRDQKSRRFRYVSRDGRGEFVYCDSINSWVFRDPLRPKEGNKCGWWVMSEKSDSFDLLSMSASEWYLKDSFNIKTPMDWMYLAAYNSKFKRGGVCSDGKRYGLSCEFSDPCRTLTIDRNTDLFGHGQRVFPSEYDLVSGLEIYHRPVYVGQAREYAELDVILFTGRRWVIISTMGWAEWDVTDSTELEDIGISHRFFIPSLVNHQDLNIQYISEPVDATSPSNKVAPIGLRWFRSSQLNQVDLDQHILFKSDQSSDMTTRLICALCSSTSECMHGGLCVNNTCHCHYGSKGKLCEVPPRGNGLCDIQFNKPEYDFDGGYVDAAAFAKSTCRHNYMSSLTISSFDLSGTVVCPLVSLLSSQNTYVAWILLWHWT